MTLLIISDRTNSKNQNIQQHHNTLVPFQSLSSIQDQHAETSCDQQFFINFYPTVDITNILACTHVAIMLFADNHLHIKELSLLN